MAFQKLNTEAELIAKYGQERGQRIWADRQKAELRKKNNRQVKADLSTPAAREAAIANGDAVRCLECGAVLTRLLHTHFKKKCTGRFQSGKEYQAAYPGAQVVSPNLKKMTGGGLENFLQLYGEEEGRKKYDEYCVKQAVSNSFEYKQIKHGWTEEQYNEYNKSRASTEENFIARHGVEEGTKLWKEYCERQSYTTTLEYFIEQYGEEEGRKKYEEFDKARLNVGGRDGVSKMELDALAWIMDDILQIGPDVQFTVQHKINGYKFDLVFPTLNKAIEFNGTNWHADPSVYKADQFIPFVEKTAQEVWEKDKVKMNAAEEAGYSVFVVWQREYERKHLQTDLIERLIKWWNAPNQLYLN